MTLKHSALQQRATDHFSHGQLEAVHLAVRCRSTTIISSSSIWRLVWVKLRSCRRSGRQWATSGSQQQEQQQQAPTHLHLLVQVGTRKSFTYRHQHLPNSHSSSSRCTIRPTSIAAQRPISASSKPPPRVHTTALPQHYLAVFSLRNAQVLPL